MKEVDKEKDPKDESKKEVQKKELRSELFEPDKMDDEKFVWQEQELKPGFARPVMIHRAILGSIERCIGTLIEQKAAKLPFFISPRQVCILPISENYNEFCESLKLRLINEGYSVVLDLSNNNLNKKIRNACILNFNYICVIGEEEIKAKVVDVRNIEGKRMGKIDIQEFIQFLHFENQPPISNPKKKILSKMYCSESERNELLNPSMKKFNFIKSEEHKVSKESKDEAPAKEDDEDAKDSNEKND